MAASPDPMLPNHGRAVRPEAMHRRVEVGWPARRILAQSARAIAQSRTLELRVRQLEARFRTSEGRVVKIADAALATLAARRDTHTRGSQLNLGEHAALAQADLVAAVTHEMRTPLQAILGYAQLLTEGATGSFAETREFARRIVISSLSLAQVVENLIQLSAARLGRVQLDIGSFDAQRLIADVVRFADPLARHKRIVLRTDLVPLEMTSDMRRLRQIVANLVENAIRRTESGEVVVRLSAGVAADCATVTIMVCDSGPGFDAPDLPNVFEPFRHGIQPVQASMHDTGLGLSTVRQLTRLLGGEARAVEAPDGGCAYIVELPRVAPATESAAG